MKTEPKQPKVGIFIVAYNAAETIKNVLSRVPETAWEKIHQVYVFDDASNDNTVDVALQFAGVHRDKISVFGNQINLGYGGNQKRGYQYAIEQGHDIVVLLHGDGQYAPECIEKMIEPIVDGRAQAVFGSRMIDKGGALKGGMPLYKYVGNKVLSTFQNWIIPGTLTEYHSGYRAYHVPSLAKLPLLENTNDFHFDTEIIIQLREGEFIIEEMAIPTYYGDEVCHVDGLKYAWDVFKATLSYSFHKKGLRFDARFDLQSGAKYTYKNNRFSSHERIVSLLPAKTGSGEDARPLKILDVGCGSGFLAARIAECGHCVDGMDVYENDEARSHCDRFIVADAEDGLEPLGEEMYDRIIFADILEHVRNSEELLLEANKKLNEDGRIIISTGNVAHVFIRLMLAFGRFDYTERGILDRTHVRLFTINSFKQLVDDCSYQITQVRYCPIPFENIIMGHPGVTDFLSWLNMAFVRILPGLFAYQIVIEAKPRLDRPSDLLRQQQILDGYIPEQRK